MDELNKILILGAGEGQVPLILMAKKAGWHTTVVSPQGHYPGFEYADRCYYLDISDEKGVLRLAHDIQIRAIATDQTDISMPTVVSVAKEMGLPCIKCANIYNFQLKSLMRGICKQEGIPTIEHYVTSDLDTAKRFYSSIPNGKAIVKPIDSQGSRGISLVCSINDLSEAFSVARDHSRSGCIIIEHFVNGHEIEVDTVMKDGEVVSTLIGDVFNFEIKNTFSAFERIYPAQMGPALKGKIIKYNESVLKALGLSTGWTHGEYIITENNDVLLLEVGLRGGGNFIGSDVLRTMIGVGTDEMAFLTAIGDSSFYNRIKTQEGHCAYKCFYLPEGEVEAIDIDKDLLTKPFVLRHNLDSIYVGKHISGTRDKTSRYTIVIKASTPHELRVLLDSIQNRIHISVMTSSGIKDAIWK